MIREATELFLDEFARWLKEVPEKKPEEEIVEKLCDGMDHLFHTPPERIGKMIPKINPEIIQEKIETASAANGFRWSKNPSEEPGGKNRWILWKDGRELTVTLEPENYMFIDGSDWSMCCFGFNGLMNAIGFWSDADGAMS